MTQEKTPQTKPKEQPLRFSRPPYTVFLWDGPDPAFTIPGNVLKALGRGLAPTAEDVRAMLRKLRNELRWSRDTMSGVLGVSREVIRRWETGQRNPSGAARRLIWLIDALFFHRGKIPTALDLVVWGQGRDLAAFAKATGMDWP
jgi:DNA-binding transcriptional regulator YiaG